MTFTADAARAILSSHSHKAGALTRAGAQRVKEILVEMMVKIMDADAPLHRLKVRE